MFIGIRVIKGVYKTYLFVLFSIVRGLGINKLAPIKIATIERHNNDLCGCDIGSNGDVVSVASKKKLALDLIVTREARRRASVTEIDKNVYFVISDSGSDLLLAALLTAEQFFNLKSCRWERAF